MNTKKTVTIFTLLVCLYFNIATLAFAETENQKYPDYAAEYLGEDKYENFNRKMFNLNMKLNKYALRPIHIVWASIMPKYGMDRIQSAYTNIQYPKRLISSLVQKDFKTTKNETVRFITNSTIGIGGMFDPAEKLLKIEPREEGMEEALAKCKIKQGPYLVMPWINSTTPRGMAGSLLDNALNPSNYIGTPVIALVKLGFTVNRTYYMQPICKMLESTYADPYDIAKKMYGLERYIKALDLDRKEILETSIKLAQEDINNGTLLAGNVDDIREPGTGTDSFQYPRTPQAPMESVSPPMNNESTNQTTPPSPVTPSEINREPRFQDPHMIKDPGTRLNEDIQNKIHKVNKLKTAKLKTDINLDDYHPQNPVTDAMRTALFEQPDVTNSIWSEFSIWNRCFRNKIKSAYISVDPTKDKYEYRYILQKDRTSPVAIIYPSIGEGVNSHHSDVIAKIFYDEGYSVIIQGSHFQWEFVKSMPDSYKPGLPSRDADYLKLVTRKILDNLESKHKCQFREKTVIGTSFGAMTSLFLADKESENNTLNIDKYISINPPIELLYAMKQIDKNTEEWQKNPDNLKDKVAITASKIIQMTQLKDKGNTKIDILPFNDDEAKLITGFVLHQKLSDLVFTIENASKTQKSDIYKMVNNMNYEDYARKYLAANEDNLDELAYETSLHSISNFLKTHDNYKIYHTLDDYLVNPNQLTELKSYAGNNLVMISNGSHLGYLYRDEFLAELKQNIAQKKEMIANK